MVSGEHVACAKYNARRVLHIRTTQLKHLIAALSTVLYLTPTHPDPPLLNPPLPHLNILSLSRNRILLYSTRTTCCSAQRLTVRNWSSLYLAIPNLDERKDLLKICVKESVQASEKRRYQTDAAECPATGRHGALSMARV